MIQPSMSHRAVQSAKFHRRRFIRRLGKFERLEDRRLLCFPVTGSPFQNQANPCDVSADGFVNALDGLTVIGFINTNGAGPPPAGFQPPPFVDVDGDGLVNQEDVDIVIAVTMGGLVGPVVLSATLGNDSQSVIVQFNDDDLDQATAESLDNYALTAAAGDTNRNGNFFDDGDEVSVRITSATYSPASDQVVLAFESALADDVFRLDLLGAAIRDQDGNGLSGGNYFQDFDLQTTSPGVAVLDVNGDGTANPFQDAILIVRYMLGQPETNLEDPALITSGSTRTTGQEILTFLNAAGDSLDVNGDGNVNPFQDGILIVRFMLGQPDANLVDPALIPAGSTRTTADAIRAHLEALLPPAGKGGLPSNEIVGNDIAGNGDAGDALVVVNRSSADVVQLFSSDSLRDDLDQIQTVAPFVGISRMVDSDVGESIRGIVRIEAVDQVIDELAGEDFVKDLADSVSGGLIDVLLLAGFARSQL